MIYVGQTRGGKLHRRMEALGWGEMTQPKEFPPRRTPWVLDNGAFRDWKAGRPFNAELFTKTLDRIDPKNKPDFIVAPDMVARGAMSLHFSLDWVERIRQYDCPVYFAAQDGMDFSSIRFALMQGFDGLFVGGTLDWKLRNGGKLVHLGHELKRPVHIGRVGTAKRVRWAFGIKANSIDSCLPLFSCQNFDTFVHAISLGMAQTMLFD